MHLPDLISRSGECSSCSCAARRPCAARAARRDAGRRPPPNPPQCPSRQGTVPALYMRARRRLRAARQGIRDQAGRGVEGEARPAAVPAREVWKNYWIRQALLRGGPRRRRPDQHTRAGGGCAPKLARRRPPPPPPTRTPARAPPQSRPPRRRRARDTARRRGVWRGRVCGRGRSLLDGGAGGGEA
jgi:hypothetical protein